LINQANLIGVLYLENNLSAHVFAPTQIAVLKLVASQAATSLENSRLYADLQEREAKIRRLFDANIIGILIWDFEDHILDANDTFLQMVGYDRDELASGGICWTKLTPEEWQDSDARAMEDLKRFGATQSFEKEYFRRDGSRVPVLLAAATFEGRNQGVAFVLDLTERKRVEAEARENEEKYREMQTELAHVNRVTTMGQLVASIAHEVSQPITALVTNSEAAVRWLERQPPDLDEVRRCLGQVIGGGKRAGDVIGRIRSLIRKTPTRTSSFDINEAILEVIALARSEMVKHNVSLQTRLVSSLPLVEGDRVQLQQVLLNLLINAVEAMSGVGDGTRELLICTSTDASNDMIVSVRDSGPGLEQVEAGRIFDAFYTTKSNGMGMGLSICRLIIEAHGGRIWAVANQPRGAVFEFSLPLSDTRSLNNAGAG
jgi:PAS domain S-box-containing protein